MSGTARVIAAGNAVAVMLAGLAWWGVVGCDRPGAESPGRVRVGVAASVAGLVESIVSAPGIAAEPVAVHAAGSGVLAAQIRQGAPIDVVVMADPIWIDRLEHDGLVVGGSRRPLVGNEAVLVAVEDGMIAGRPNAARWVTADPVTAPLGEAADRGLRSIGWTETEIARVGRVEDAVAAVRVLTSGDADVAVLYRTDAVRLGVGWVVRRFPDPEVVTTRCEAAIVHDSESARRLLARLRDDAALAAWRRAGFIVEGITLGETAP